MHMHTQGIFEYDEGRLVFVGVIVLAHTLPLLAAVFFFSVVCENTSLVKYRIRSVA